jgi:FkbM family methyltransferase
VLTRLLRRLAGALPPRLVAFLGRVQFSNRTAARVIGFLSRPLREAEATIPHGVGAGLRINPGGANPGYALGTTEPAIQEVLARHLRPSDVFYDLGAGVGFFTLLGARLVGPAGEVWAFEPDPANAAVLRRNVELNGFPHVRVLEQAVSGQSGEARLHSSGTASRLVTDRGARPDRDETIPVAVTSVDEVVRELGGPAPTLVKFDVEGAELDALEGMRETIAATRPVIVCETHRTYDAVDRLLRELGYATQPIDPPIDGQLPWNVHVLATPLPVPGPATSTELPGS